MCCVTSDVFKLYVRNAIHRGLGNSPRWRLVYGLNFTAFFSIKMFFVSEVSSDFPPHRCLVLFSAAVMRLALKMFGLLDLKALSGFV